MDTTLKVHIGLKPHAAQTLKALPSEARDAWVEEHIHAHPVTFETFETYGFLSCTLDRADMLSTVKAAPEVDWVEIDRKMSAI
ncbi:hypothetical protein PVW48_19505 [Dinoroseobacter sp. PD6]|uniref:hypothetical protein n=1 Tax=Dinoroseobacter sp. PD6 TaxID=3028384 RepID=UPI00237A2ED9|nr:hypothetical protein [Dinoroseobacter sp. PD6]MDD9718951.1 hypothetical protein [Dinoroseobacter sp. PD6]